jgi:hypothetical protein
MGKADYMIPRQFANAVHEVLLSTHAARLWRTPVSKSVLIQAGNEQFWFCKTSIFSANNIHPKGCERDKKDFGQSK